MSQDKFEKEMGKTIILACHSLLNDRKDLLGQIKELQKKLLLSESQNYCKICGNTLDGYTPNA
jgi:hypothetical protein